jgi:argininosuccinate synthase
MFRANTVYEGVYLLGTSIARPLIAKKQIEIAPGRRGRRLPWRHRQGQRPGPLRARLLRAGARHPCDRAVARVVLQVSREALLAFAEKHQIPIAKDKRGEAPFSVDANLLHSSSEGKVLEDPAVEAPEFVYSAHDRAGGRARQGHRLHHGLRGGDPVAIDGVKMSPATLLAKLNQLGHDNGIGRLDLVENRFVGMKSRGVYETPGGTILLVAHRASSPSRSIAAPCTSRTS